MPTYRAVFLNLESFVWADLTSFDITWRTNEKSNDCVDTRRFPLFPHLGNVSGKEWMCHLTLNFSITDRMVNRERNR